MADASDKIHSLDRPTPRALILATQRPGQSDADVAASCAEMTRLADTLGISVVATELQKRAKATANFVGSGKLAELAVMTGGPGENGSEVSDEDVDDEAARRLADIVLVDAELTPRQLRLLERALGVEVLDRTAVILEIFEKRAGTREAALEVELARLRYELPRKRDRSAGNDRQGGGGRGARGNTNLSIGKGRIRDRIAELQSELSDVQAQANTQRARRQDAFQVALVGYTNAGKSSLMHGLTASEVLVEDQLFATLGTTVRQVQPPASPGILLSDTVGFIRDLPHELIASFRSTLDEALDADHLLLVVDSSDPEWRAQFEVTRETLDAIGASVISQSLVLNKVDRLTEQEWASLAAEFPHAIMMSAKNPDDVRGLRDTLVEIQDMGLCEETLLVPYGQSALLGEIHERSHVMDEGHSAEGAILRVRAREANLDRWRSKLPRLAQVETVGELLAAAARLGLHLMSDEDDDVEVGSDSVRLLDEDERGWMARVPAGPRDFAQSRVEGRALRFLSSRLSVEVPDLQLHSPLVIACPALEGHPASSRFDSDALPPLFIDSVAQLLAALQAIPVTEVVAARLPVKSLDDVRENHRKVLRSTRAALAPTDEVWESWSRWLDNEGVWPQHTRIVHGNLQPGNLLCDGAGKLVGVLGWAGVEVADPATDFVTWYGAFGRAALDALLRRFEAHGGTVWPGILDHIIGNAEFQALFAQRPGELH